MQSFDNISVASANLIGGAAASVASTTVVLPLEVISQRLMVQDGKQNANQYQYKNGLTAFFKIIQTEGVRGLYKGYGATLAIYAPSSAVWWLTYSSSRSRMGSYSVDHPTIVNGISGMIAGATSAVLLNPFDVAKTRLQVLNVPGRKNLFTVFMSLIKEEGFKALTRGVTARMANITTVSLIMITVYENVKKISIKER